MQLGWNPAVAAHGKARKIGELASEHAENLSFLLWKIRILYGYELISEARSLFWGDVGDAVFKLSRNMINYLYWLHSWSGEMMKHDMSNQNCYVLQFAMENHSAVDK